MTSLDSLAKTDLLSPFATNTSSSALSPYPPLPSEYWIGFSASCWSRDSSLSVSEFQSSSTLLLRMFGITPRAAIASCRPGPSHVSSATLAVRCRRRCTAPGLARREVHQFSPKELRNLLPTMDEIGLRKGANGESVVVQLSWCIALNKWSSICRSCRNDLLMEQ